MRVESFQRHQPLRQQERQQKEPGLWDSIQDKVHIGRVSLEVALPGILKGGMFGVCVGVGNTLPLALLFGLKPVLITAGVLGAVGAVAGGALYLSLADLD